MVSALSKALKAVGRRRDRQYSNLKSDETLVFFNTAAWLDAATETWNIPIHGWVYEPQSSWALRKVVAELLERKYQLRAETPVAKQLFRQRLNLFMADNERRKRIIIEFNNQWFELPSSAPNGQFEGVIKLKNSDVNLDNSNQISYSAVLKDKDERVFAGSVEFIEPRGISVISDIDDTVKMSFITDRKKMFEAAFYQKFQPVKGMAGVYQNWHHFGASFHYVSSSPWQLYEPLIAFMQEFEFPRASLSLKKVRLKDETFLNLFKSGLKTKPLAVSAIMQRYPDRQFILVGDSGEQDAQVYAQIAHRFPNQVKKILIRNVSASKTLNKEYESVFSGLPRRLWKTFVYPSQIRLDLEQD